MTKPPAKLDTHDLSTWRADWDRVGPLLERIRCDELRRLTESARKRSLDRLLAFGCQFRRPKPVCGLAEFYRRVREHYG